MPPSSWKDHAALSACRGSRIATAKEAKRDPIASPRPRLVPCACPAPTVSPAASGSSPGSASDGVRPRPAAATAEARVRLGLVQLPSSRVRPHPTASKALAAPGRLREVILAALCGAFIFAICSTALAGGRRRQRSRQAWASSSVPARQIASDSFHRPKTPAYTVASSHASALPTSRAHRSTCVQKNPRAKP